MHVWIAVINHRHGTNIYAGTTQRALQQQVFDYVQEWWGDANMEGTPSEADMAGSIDRFFEDNDREWCEMDSIPLLREE